jgi:hypothetical protein
VVATPEKIFSRSVAQYEETFGTGDMIQAPVVVNTEYNCLDIDEEGVCQLLTPDGNKGGRLPAHRQSPV